MGIWKKMFSVTHQGNANQKPHEIPFRTCQDGCCQKSKSKCGWGGEIGNRTLLEIQNGAAAVEDSLEGPQEENLPEDPAIPLLGIYPKEVKTTWIKRKHVGSCLEPDIICWEFSGEM